jgi:hypothetical protein
MMSQGTVDAMAAAIVESNANFERRTSNVELRGKDGSLFDVRRSTFDVRRSPSFLPTDATASTISPAYPTHKNWHAYIAMNGPPMACISSRNCISTFISKNE